MDPQIASIVKMALISGTIIVGIIAQGLVSRRRKSSAPPPDLGAITSRLDRIELAIDSIAIEMERVSEAQRFTTRVLAERGPEGTPAKSPARVVTPH